MEEMELELGSLLKKAREEKGLIIDDIQEETKIRKKYLEAIEANNFDILPGKVYLKVFVKGYAREVGLDYQELLKKYEVLNIKEEKESNLQKDYLNDTKVSSGAKNKDRKNPFKIIFIVLLILFLAAAAVYTYQYINNSELRLLNQQTSQNENIEEDSELLEIEENDNSEMASGNEEESADSEETADDNSSDISDLDLNSSDNEENNNNLFESFESDVLTEENTEIIDQNNFNEPEGLDSQEQNQISEIIITEELNNQQQNEENNEQENVENEIEDSEEEDAAQSDIGQENNENNENNQNEEGNSAEAVNLANNEEVPADETENQEEAVLDNNIEILASDTVWVTIDVDGANVFSGILETGDQRQFEVEDRLYIKIGNGSAITAEMGGESYGPWAGDGGIAEVEFLNDGEEITINNLRE